MSRPAVAGTILLALVGFVPSGTTNGADPTPVGPPRPVPTAADGYDLIIFAQHRPLRVRVTVSYLGRPASERWAGAVRRAFAHFDRDGDGFLNGSEIRFAFSDAGLAALMLNGSYAPNPGGRPTLAAVDRDGDGRVSFDELFAYYRGAAAQAVRAFPAVAENPVNARATEALFKLFDADGDGKLSRAEVAGAEKLLAALDADEDECLSLAELVPGVVAEQREARATGAATPLPVPAGGPPRTVALSDLGRVPGTITQQILKRYDVDGDGAIGRREIAFDADLFARLDTDGDGKLSPEELDDWRTGSPDLDVSLSLAPTGGSKATVTTDPAVVAARGFVVRQEEARRLVVRHGRQAAEFGAYAGDEAVAGSLKRQYAGLFGQAAGAKGYAVEKDLAGPQLQLVRLLFDPADRDGDGKLTKEEFERHLDIQQTFIDLTLGVTAAVQTPTLFQLLDENRDGRLGVRELRTAWDRLIVLEPAGDGATADVITRAALQPAVSVRLTRAFDRAGPVAAVNFGGANRGGASTAGPVWFRKMDRNGDGDVSRAEFLGTREQFDALDADRDGLISVAEAAVFDRSARGK